MQLVVGVDYQHKSDAFKSHPVRLLVNELEIRFDFVTDS